jgi:hypothetical protein
MIYPAANLLVFAFLSCGPTAAVVNPRYPQPAMEAPLKIVVKKPCAFSGQRLLLTGKVKKIHSSHTFSIEDDGKLLVRTTEAIADQIGPLREGVRISISGVLVTVESEEPILVAGPTDIVMLLPSGSSDCDCDAGKSELALRSPQLKPENQTVNKGIGRTGGRPQNDQSGKEQQKQNHRSDPVEPVRP